jgi:phosphodiesterase/alkaline phosphatase D-like protein
MVSGFSNLNVGSVTSYGITGLAVNTTYFYRVRAYNSVQTSVSSNIIDQRTQAPPSDIVATAATAITQSSFYANWGASTEPVVGYLLDVATDVGFLNKVEGYDNRDIGNVLTYIVRLLTAGTTYYYRIKGYNLHGVLSVNYSNIITTATLPQVAPDAPIAIAATSTYSTGFTANWNAVAGATGYLLDVSNDERTWRSFVTGYNGLDVGNVTSFNVTGLTPSVQYYYRVRAYNADGTSVVSNTIYVTSSPPPAPTIVLSESNWNFGGSGPTYKKRIYVTLTNAASWGVLFPSDNGYIHAYDTNYNVVGGYIDLYYDGTVGTGDSVDFAVYGLDGSIVLTTFTGRWT